jgi:FkbM family methyltransferase
MREKLWLRFRNSKLLRTLSSSSVLGKPIRAASNLLMPSLQRKEMKIRAGIGKGLIMEINPRWETEMWEGTYEANAQQLFARHLREGMTFYDVGGGLGFYSMVAARLGANVFVFEPAAANSALIAYHVKKNALETRIHIIHSAVFSRTGVISLRSNERETGHANYSVEWADQGTTQLPQVSCTTLDDFARENPKPDFLKIDIEGAESDALKGAEMLFRTVRPPLICEIHDEVNAAFITRWLSEKNYQSRWLEDQPGFPRYLYASPLS